MSTKSSNDAAVPLTDPSGKDRPPVTCPLASLPPQARTGVCALGRPASVTSRPIRPGVSISRRPEFPSAAAMALCNPRHGRSWRERWCLAEVVGGGAGRTWCVTRRNRRFGCLLAGANHITELTHQLVRTVRLGKKSGSLRHLLVARACPPGRQKHSDPRPGLPSQMGQSKTIN